MIGLGFESYLVTWMSFFQISHKVQLVIDGYKNKGQKIETRISGNSLVLLILFLIYISKVFIKVSETTFLVTFFFFVDNLSFVVSGILAKEMVKTIEKVVKKVIE